MTLVYFSAWLAAACFFIGRLRFQISSAERNRIQHRLDIVGVIILWIHIALAYAIAHDGSHEAAVEHVASRTQEMIGIHSGLGIYANFAVALSWTWLATLQAYTSAKLTFAINGFLWLMFLAACIPFATFYSASFFTALAIFCIGTQRFPLAIRNRPGK